MFKLVLPNNAQVYALNHLPVEDHVRKHSRYSLPRVNYFDWVAYPMISRGCILVSEKSLKDALATGSTGVGLPCKLLITDETTTLTYENISIDSINVFNSSIINDSEVLEKRLLCIHFHLQRDFVDGDLVKCADDGMYTGYHGTWSSLTNFLFQSASLLTAPLTFNRFINYQNVPINKLIAFIANSQFITAYPDRAVTTKCKLTDSLFNPNSVNVDSILFVDYGTTYKKINLQIRFPILDYKFGVLRYYTFEGDDLATIVVEDPSQISTLITDFISQNTIAFSYPFDLVDEDDPTIPTLIASHYTAIKQNCANRLSSRVYMVLRGISTQVITNDIQQITYAYDQRGTTTTFKTLEWALPEYDFLDQSTNDIIFVAELLTNMNVPLATANIFHPLNLVTPVALAELVYDPLNLVNKYCAGTKCYVARTYAGEYVIISGPCPPKTNCPVLPSTSGPPPEGE